MKAIENLLTYLDLACSGIVAFHVRLSVLLTMSGEMICSVRPIRNAVEVIKNNESNYRKQHEHNQHSTPLVTVVAAVVAEVAAADVDAVVAVVGAAAVECGQ
jgi:predicted tellurium resistance membrane protein TerC